MATICVQTGLNLAHHILKSLPVHPLSLPEFHRWCLLSRCLWFVVCFGKLSLSDISIRNNQATSDRTSVVAKVPSKWRGRRKRTELRPCWRVKCGIGWWGTLSCLFPAGWSDMFISSRMERHPTLHTPAWPKFNPFSATVSFWRDFGHRACCHLILCYGYIWKGEFTKTNYEP